MSDQNQLSDGQADVSPYGSTGDTHAGMMAALWGPVANIAIFLVLYSYRKIWTYIHGAFFLFATIHTFIMTVPILLHTGMVSPIIPLSSSHPPLVLYLHYVIGITSMTSMIIAAMSGILTKLSNIFQAKSNTILLIRKIHTIIGYLLVLICKTNYYLINTGITLNQLIACDVIFAILIVIRKIIFPRM